MDKICIIGASNAMISMVIDNLESNNYYPEITIINNQGNIIEKEVFPVGFNISTSVQLLQHHYTNPFILGVNKPNNKISIITEMNLTSLSFTNLMHKTAAISSTVTIKKGVVINSLVSIAAYSTLNDFVTINRNVSIGHNTVIGSYTTINPGVNIAGFVNVGEGSTIGMGTNVLDHVRIGSNTIIGAGSLVTKDIPDNVIAYGSPCQIIRQNEI